MSCLVVRYHEIALKGGNRQRFVGRLIDNLRDVTRGLGVRSVQSLQGRIAMWLAEGADIDEILARVTLTFGVANVSLALETLPSIEAIRDAALAATVGRRFASFRVATRRAHKQFPLTSPEINALVGRSVQDATGAAVDLEHPELTVRIEVLPRRAFVSCRTVAGPGGLPVTISGRVACLLSGGIDSPVAAHRMMRRGCRVDFVHFYGSPYTSRASLEKAADLAAHLTRFQLRTDLWSVPFGDIQARIVAQVPRTHRVVLYRRMMLRIATVLARRARDRALVTGESLGQVSSQTIENMTVIDAATTMLVLRPLVGMDKAEIIAEAQRIGTFETSILPDQDCCSLFVPPHPTTRATPGEVTAAEAALDVEALVAQGVTAAAHARFVYPPNAGSTENGGTDGRRVHSGSARAS